MPNWQVLRSWRDPNRHLDLFMLIWLHPSWDEQVLTPLRDAYVQSDEVVLGDISNGFGGLGVGISRASADYSRVPERDIPNNINTDGHFELLFKIIMGDLTQSTYHLKLKTDPDSDFAIFHDDTHQEFVYQKPLKDFNALFQMGKWLCIKNMDAINNDMLYQYDQPLEYWYQCCQLAKEDYYSREKCKTIKEYTEKSLWRIYNFDTEKEGDSPRTRFVIKMRKLLNERHFIKDFSDMWQAVKAGKINPPNPWKR